jgi:FAD:protein FMN transferase
MPTKLKIRPSVMISIFAAVIVFSTAGYFASRPSETSVGGEIVSTGFLMGTFVQVKAISSELRKEEIKRAVEGAFALAADLEKRLSIFDAESELNKLNLGRSAEGSSELLEVLSVAGRINSWTFGAFDPTVAPVLKRNGFYRGMPDVIFREIPENDHGIGFDNVRIDEPTGMIFLDNGAWLDLSGIAKGYIVDKMAMFLRENGVSEFIVNAGGDIFCSKRPSGNKWRIGIRRPGTKEMSLVLAVENMAVATSGDYENVITGDGNSVAVSHIADPFSRSNSLMVPMGFTAIASECVMADGLATGITVLGPEKAVKTADSIDGVEVIAIMRPEGEEKVLLSGNAEKYISGR